MSQPRQSLTVIKLWLILYPFTMAAVAVNLYMLSLAWQRLGLPALSPTNSVLISMLLCIPVNWLAAKWVRRLMDEADG